MFEAFIDKVTIHVLGTSIGCCGTFLKEYIGYLGIWFGICHCNHIKFLSHHLMRLVHG
jgi:hypothetical protein